TRARGWRPPDPSVVTKAERSLPDPDMPLECVEEDLRRCGYLAKSARKRAAVQRPLRIEHRNRVEACFKWSMIHGPSSIELRIEHFPISLFVDHGPFEILGLLPYFTRAAARACR